MSIFKHDISKKRKERFAMLKEKAVHIPVPAKIKLSTDNLEAYFEEMLSKLNKR